jgi:ABC-type multidrug transport system fused ATPase/permease subunit
MMSRGVQELMRRASLEPLVEEDANGAGDELGADLSAGPSLSRLFQLAAREKYAMALNVLLSVVGFAVHPAGAIMVGKAIDAMNQLEKKDVVAHTTQILVVYALIVGFAHVAFVFLTMNVEHTGARVCIRLRLTLYRSLMRHEMSFFDLHKTGELMSRLHVDTEQIKEVIEDAPVMIGVLEVCSVALAMLIMISWKLLLIIIAMIPALGCIGSIASHFIGKFTLQSADSWALASTFAEEGIGNVRTVRSFAAGRMEMRRYVDAMGNPDFDLENAGFEPGESVGSARRVPSSGCFCCWQPPKKAVPGADGRSVSGDGGSQSGVPVSRRDERALQHSEKAEKKAERGKGLEKYSVLYWEYQKAIVRGVLIPGNSLIFSAFFW